MKVLRNFRKCSILQPVFDEPVGNFQKPIKTLADALKIVNFIGRVPLGEDFTPYGSILPICVPCNKANTGARWVHITTRNETHRKSSPTPINTKRDESPQPHLTVSTTLRSFREELTYKK